MQPFWQRDGITAYQGHVLDVLRGLPAESVQCCVTSPPYWGLRDYGLPPQVWDGAEGCAHEWSGAGPGFHPGQVEQSKWKTANAAGKAGNSGSGCLCSLCGAWRGSLGLEPTPQLYIAHLVQVFDEVRRVLRGDGVLFVVIADSYASGKGTCHNPGGGPKSYIQEKERYPLHRGSVVTLRENGLKPKDLCLVPERFALAMQDAGWWVRSRICWAKLAPMPESVTDRPTSAWEHVWMFTKAARYVWDVAAVREPFADERMGRDGSSAQRERNRGGRTDGYTKPNNINPSANGSRNLRNFWLLGPEPRPEAHYATYPSEIPRRCIKAATSERGCCPKCGKAWVRVVERINPSPSKHNGTKTAEKVAQGLATAFCGYEDGSPAPTFKTLGWRPACDCGTVAADLPIIDGIIPYEWPDPVPCTILDPFLGSGTTLEVAAELRRHGVGIELNESYLRDIAVPRLEAATAQMVLV